MGPKKKSLPESKKGSEKNPRKRNWGDVVNGKVLENHEGKPTATTSS